MTETNTLIEASADGSESTESPTASARRLTIVEQLQDLRVQVEQQNTHIADLHEMVDQLIDYVNRELGSDWQPDLHAGRAARVTNATNAIISGDRSLRARRADRFKGPQP